MATVAVNGVEIGYDEAGSGPAVVLVHASLGDRRMWEHQFQTLSADHRVVRYDCRGVGDSGVAEGEYAHHEDLLGLLDALRIEQATLIGASMGGAYSVEVALAAPQRIAALALVCSGLTGHDWPPEMTAQAQALIAAELPMERVRAYYAHTATWVDPADATAMARAQLRFMMVGPGRQIEDLDPAAWKGAVEMCRDVFAREWSGPAGTERQLVPPAKGRLGEVIAPTLVLGGRYDVPEILAVSDLLADGIPGARRVDLPTGHLPSLESPAALTEVLRPFLTAIDA